MRKICSSRSTWWRVSFSFRALVRSVPNGFSMITRAFSVRPASARVWITSVAAAGGTLR